MYKTIAAVSLLCCLTCLASCKQMTQSVSDTFNGRPEEIRDPAQNPLIRWFKSNRDYLGDTAWLKKAGNKFRKLSEFSGRKIMLYDKVYFYEDGRIVIKVQAAGNPEHINEYRYDNENWSPPQPVRLRSREISTIPEELFYLDSLSFPAVSKVWKSYNKAAAEKGAKTATFVCFDFQNDHRNSRWLPVRIDGARAVWQIKFDKEGNIVLLERR